MSEQEFIQTVSECTVKEMEASGITASISIAQAILESGYGTAELVREEPRGNSLGLFYPERSRK